MMGPWDHKLQSTDQYESIESLPGHAAWLIDPRFASSRGKKRLWHLMQWNYVVALKENAEENASLRGAFCFSGNPLIIYLACPPDNAAYKLGCILIRVSEWFIDKSPETYLIPMSWVMTHPFHHISDNVVVKIVNSIRVLPLNFDWITLF